MLNHDENMKFLDSFYKGKKNLTEHGDLCDWYFSSTDCSVEVCAHRAYRDFCRRLTGIKENGQKKKTDWRADEEQFIAGRIQEMLKDLPKDANAFDKWHKDLCEKVVDKVKEHQIELKESTCFSYGLAQKWVNMTLKNMIVMEQWNQEMHNLVRFLHVPVDSYIMEAASKEFAIPFLNKRSKVYEVYNSEHSKPWSKWEYEEYIEFQKKIRKQTDLPIIWEGPAWRRIRESRKSK